MQHSTGARSYFHSEVHRDGKLIYSSFRSNLTTDTAVGYTNRRDWQAKAMGLADTDTDYVGFATSTGATSLAVTGATFTTTGQGLAGRIVACGPNSAGAGSTVFGVIIANTATTLMVDRWYNPWSLALGTTPSGTASYQVLPWQFPAPYIALTANASAPSASDTVLAAELTTDGFTRQLGVFTHTAGTGTYTLQAVFTATGTQTINKVAIAGSAVPSTGVMPFESLEPSAPTLVAGDMLTQTDLITIN